MKRLIIYSFIISCCLGCFSSKNILEKVDYSKHQFSKPIEFDRFNYLPDLAHPEHRPIQYLRLNFHAIDSNLIIPNNGQPSAKKAYQKYIHELIAEANHILNNNQKANLPIGNETPIYPIQIQFVLDEEIGEEPIYFHDSPSLAYDTDKNNRSLIRNRSLYRKSQYQDSVINIFLIAKRNLVEDTMASVEMQGYTWRKQIKLINFNHYNFNTNKAARVLIHEIGHVLGLKHTWGENDGCGDTPQHENCWETTITAPCNTAVSNNVMDYNKHCDSWTPCQIANIKKTLNNLNATERKFLTFKYQQAQDIIINSKVTWSAERDVFSNIIIKKGGHLIINGRIGLFNNATLYKEKGGMLNFGEQAYLHSVE